MQRERRIQTIGAEFKSFFSTLHFCVKMQHLKPQIWFYRRRTVISSVCPSPLVCHRLEHEGRISSKEDTSFLLCRCLHPSQAAYSGWGPKLRSNLVWRTSFNQRQRFFSITAGSVITIWWWESGSTFPRAGRLSSSPTQLRRLPTQCSRWLLCN